MEVNFPTFVANAILANAVVEVEVEDQHVMGVAGTTERTAPTIGVIRANPTVVYVLAPGLEDQHATGVAGTMVLIVLTR